MKIKENKHKISEKYKKEYSKNSKNVKRVEESFINKVIQSPLYTITYGYKEAPLNIQEAAFAANGLELVSPAQLGFLRAKENTGIFKPYSRTRADVFYDNRHNQVVIVPNGAISSLFGVNDLVDAHRKGREYVIPRDQREEVYALVDMMLKNGFAFALSHGQTQVQTSEFGKNDLTSRLFSDESLDFKAQEYGDWLQKQGFKVNTFYMDDKDYAKAQKAPYLNKLRLCGPDNDFNANGNSRNLGNNNGAFGMTFCRGFLLFILLWICTMPYAYTIIFILHIKKQESARQ